MEISTGRSVSLLLLMFFIVGSCICFFYSDRDPFSALPLNIHQEFIRTSSQLQTKLSSTQEVPAANSFSGVNHRLDSPTHIIRVGSLNYTQKLELGLAQSRLAIRRAIRQPPPPPPPPEDALKVGFVYRNPGAFYRSYSEMEKKFKIYVYEEGNRPIVHDGPWKDIYASEGRFIQEMESGASMFRTRDAHRAHVHFMPFSVTMMVKFIYDHNSNFDKSPLLRFVSDYIRVISTKYPFWNRTQGADHFMLACHDWGPDASSGHPLLYSTSIRVLCNANTSEGFDPTKDVTLPEINMLGGTLPPILLSTIPHHTTRHHLAFFAGGLHGPIRPILLNHWINRDPLLPIYQYLPANLSYYSFMLHSKFCLCPSGYEVASPRIVEAIYAECVPVIISQHYVLPFSDVLRWEAFSLQVDVSDIPNLKQILSSIPEKQYMRLKKGVRAVKKHFTFYQPAKRFDVFHMILHSIWLRRLNLHFV